MGVPPPEEHEQASRLADDGVAVAIQGSPDALAAFQRAYQGIVEQAEKMRVICEPLLSSAEEFADTYRRMTPRQRQSQAWRRLTMREVKQRLDAEGAMLRARRRPVERSAARPRERGRGRSRVTRAGPSSDDPEHDLGPPPARGRLEVAR
jgi:hypothetical protein